MFAAVKDSWALLLGVMLLMVGNGMQGTLLGIRGQLEGIGTYEMSIVMTGYFAGFLIGSRSIPGLIGRVGHVRVFAALGSLISAVLIAYAAAPNWIAWSFMRVLIGFSFCGVYISAESWLNSSADKENRGQLLAAYMIVQSIGIVSAQLMLNVGDPSGYFLFVIPSILVSLAFTPILLSAGRAPDFSTETRMSFRRLWTVSPFGCVGIFLMGGIFSALFGMVSVWGTQAGLNVKEISLFVSAIYVGGLVAQYPLGYLSDRLDRRQMVTVLTAIAAVAMFYLFIATPGFAVLLPMAALLGAISNPVYSILVAYTNDFLDRAEMAAASAGLMFLYGIGSVAGPVVTGWMMETFGPQAFFLFISVLFACLTAYGLYRMTQRAAPSSDDTGTFAVLSPTVTAYAVNYTLDAVTDDPDAEARAEAEAHDNLRAAEAASGMALPLPADPQEGDTPFEGSADPAYGTNTEERQG
ncbi:MFS transporter [Thioclava sp. 'Guangxiensis']|uniref:MFS transporter n=1 Tax=Thioclava sp. 'Guangxiensis' TaxID=3149044 RepID=UPI003877A1E5